MNGSFALGIKGILKFAACTSNYKDEDDMSLRGCKYAKKSHLRSTYHYITLSHSFLSNYCKFRDSFHTGGK